MHVPITVFFLACLTAALFVLRQIWPRLRPPVRYLLLGLSILSIVLSAEMATLGVSSVWPRANVSIRWFAVAGYELIVILLTRLRPRWLTGLIAIVLLVLVLTTSALLPLTYLFDPGPVEATSIGPGLLLLKTPWDAAGMGNHGVDATISQIPRALPFLRNQIGNVRLYDTQCDTAATTATLDPVTRSVLIRCPPSITRPGDPPHDTTIGLR